MQRPNESIRAFQGAHVRVQRLKRPASIVAIVFLIVFTSALIPRCRAEEFIITGMGVMPKAWDKEANFALLERYVHEAASRGARFLVTPEGFLDGYTSNAKLRPELTPEIYRAVGEWTAFACERIGGRSLCAEATVDRVGQSLERMKSRCTDL